MDKNRTTLLQGVIIGVLATILVFLTYQIYEEYSTVQEKGTTSVTSAAVKRKVKEMDQLIEENFLNEVNNEKLVDMMYAGIAEGLEDPYSTYYSQEEYKSMTQESEGKYEGIGVVMQLDKEKNVISVVKCYENGPADKAGIKEGDIIYKVDDEIMEDSTLSELALKIKGEDSKEVHLTIIRENESDYLEFVVEKESVEVPMVDYNMANDTIGYIAVYEFTQVTAGQFSEAILALQEQGMQELIIDLRDNPGGLVSSVCEIADYFLDKDQLIVYTEDKNGKKLEYKSKTDKEIQMPIVVLVNENSASASEIFSGMIKDYGLGTIVGETTYGKGIVQKVFPLEDGSALKLTISNYFTPNGNNIHGTGITPDIEVKLDEDVSSVDVDQKQDVQLKKAIDILTK